MIVIWHRKDNKDETIEMDGATLAEARTKIRKALKEAGEKIVDWHEKVLGTVTA